MAMLPGYIMPIQPLSGNTVHITAMAVSYLLIVLHFSEISLGMAISRMLVGQPAS